jgi:hypothetical protein
MKALKILKYVGFGILGIGFVFLFIYVTMCLWNWLIPSLFHGPVLSYWQTAGIFLLSKILLTGIAPGNHSSDYKKRWHGRYNARCESRMHESSNEQSVQEA